MGLLQATLGTPAPHGDYGYTPRRLPILLQCLLRLPDGDADTVVERAADDTPGLPYVPHPHFMGHPGLVGDKRVERPHLVADVGIYCQCALCLSKLALGIFVGLSACLTLDVTLNIDTFGLLSSRGEAAYTLIGGWSLTPGQLYIGISRLLYPFFMGLLLSHIGKLVKVKRGFYWCSLLVTVILVMPRIGGETSQWMNGVYEAVSVLALFPLIVAMGAGSNVTGKRSVALCKFLGELSYPLYITHFPLIYMQIAWARNNPDAPAGMHLFIAVSVFVLSIAIAYACLKLYDEPVREWLKQHWLMKKNTKTSK